MANIRVFTCVYMYAFMTHVTCEGRDYLGMGVVFCQTFNESGLFVFFKNWHRGLGVVPALIVFFLNISVRNSYVFVNCEYRSCTRVEQQLSQHVL